MSTHEIPLIVTSSIEAGAINKSADGSQFEILLEDPISIPGNATSCTVEVQESSIWWVIPNVITGVNDSFRINDGTNPVVTLIVPQGLYDLSGLAAAMENTVINAGLIAGTFTFLSDDATQKVVTRFNVTGASFDYTIAQTFRVILGYNSIVVGPSTFAGESFTAANVAAFNQIDFFLIHSDLVPRGIRTNNIYSQVIDQHLIRVPPGSQSIDQPRWPSKVPAWDLIGGLRKRIKFWLTDQNNVAVNTSGEDWTSRLVIKYTQP